METVRFFLYSAHSYCYFPHIPIATFRKEWALLEDAEKDQLRKGIGDGTYTY